MKEMLVSWEKGDAAGALKIHRQLLPLFKALFLETSPAPCKAALALMGMCAPEVRLPLANAKDSTIEALRKAMAPLNLKMKG